MKLIRMAVASALLAAGRDPATGRRWASADGRRDMWRTGGLWCSPCDDARIARLNQQFAEIRKSLKTEES